MKKRTIGWLIAAIVLILAGSTLFASAMFAMGWDFARFNTTEYEANTHEINEDFEHISIETDTADIIFALSEDGSCKVVCHESKDEPHVVSVTDGTLTISRSENKKLIQIHFVSEQTKITVYLPQAEYDFLSVKASTGDIKIPKDLSFKTVDTQVSTGDVSCSASVSETLRIKTTTGNVRVNGVSANAIKLTTSSGKITASDISCEGELCVKVSTGKTYLTDIACESLFSEGDTGDISLTNVIAEKSFSITRSTGDVTFEDCDAGEIFVKTDTGKISGTLLSEKDFSSCRSDTGSLRVPKNGSGGKCELVTDTGNITIELSYNP